MLRAVTSLGRISERRDAIVSARPDWEYIKFRWGALARVDGIDPPFCTRSVLLVFGSRLSTNTLQLSHVAAEATYSARVGQSTSDDPYQANFKTPCYSLP